MNDTALTILEYLAQYKFLCVSQFETLGIDVSRKTFYDILKTLRAKQTALIGRRVFAYHPKYGRLEDMYYLTPKGKKYLVNQHKRLPASIKMPIGNTLFYKDYHHRKTTIDIHIAIGKVLNPSTHELHFYDHYFEGRLKTI